MQRTDRISEEMKKELSHIIQNELKDPRLDVMISVVHVDVTNDLSYAKVYVSVLADDDKKNEAIKGLKSAAGFVRKEIGRRMNLRHTPEILFEKDNSIEYGAHMAELIKKTVENDENK